MGSYHLHPGREDDGSDQGVAVKIVEKLKYSNFNLEPIGHVDKLWPGKKMKENRYSGDFRKSTVGTKQQCSCNEKWQHKPV